MALRLLKLGFYDLSESSSPLISGKVTISGDGTTLANVRLGRPRTPTFYIFYSLYRVTTLSLSLFTA